ncbi:MAG TPA: AMP-binding protein [Actinocrinis sp.]|uniref:AMP-binding protein n=1 Tax=Actinocrinis sp. TaxID=1920516 RepID=UPI002DDD5E60|nr:AMP-binding protein [Actinocrinis sp.]HEV3172573.1 AMP-binding protein [Actinocrinis sp.]
MNDRHAGNGAHPTPLDLFDEAAADLSDQARARPTPVDLFDQAGAHSTLLDLSDQAAGRRTLLNLFDQAAAARCDAVAVEYAGATTSYAQLAAASRRVADRLARLGVGPGDRVAVQLEPGVDLIAALLAVLRRGAAYVPLDAQSPPSRNRLILDDAAPRAVIGDVQTGPHRTAAVLSRTDLSTLIEAGGPEANGTEPAPVAAPLASTFDAAPPINPPFDAAPHLAPTPYVAAPLAPTSDDVCYVIYTSGATGRPKGIPIKHRNVTALFDATGSLFDFTPDDAWLLYHSAAVALSAWELWGALIHGARLVIADPWTKLSPDACADLVLASGVTVLNQTPTAFETLGPAIIDRVRQGARIAVRYVVFGGEPPAPASLGPWADTFGFEYIAVITMHGLAEATEHATYHRVTAADLSGGTCAPLPGFTASVNL